MKPEQELTGKVYDSVDELVKDICNPEVQRLYEEAKTKMLAKGIQDSHRLDAWERLEKLDWYIEWFNNRFNVYRPGNEMSVCAAETLREAIDKAIIASQVFTP